MSRQIVPRRVSGVHGRLEYDSEDETTLIASKLFDKYCTANTFAEITSTFQQICDVLELKPSDHQNFYNTIKSRLTSWKAQSLWAKLDKRAQQREYKKGNACSNTRTLIIGAGPCGLRIAIEVAFLGGKAVVVEKRDRFSRNNVLHLWPFLIHDLKALGAKKFFGKFCTGAVDHVSIRSLQCILLKVALLVGVEIHHNLSFEELVEPPEDQSNEKVGWRALVTPRDHPISEYEFDVLIGADGKRNTLKGFKRKEFRGKLAIAITANFINRNTNMEARVEEISGVAFIFNQKFFKDLNQKTGIDLENIVYYKDETHYFVMTAKKHSLLNKGVLINDLYDTAKLLSPDNVNQEALLNYAREAADVSTRQKLPHLDYAHNHYGQPDVAMFDFTSIYAAEHASRVVERHGHKLLMGLCGDSLIEPFWPTGSGCARGFLGAMDMAWAIKNWASGRFTPLEVMAHRESIYQLLSQTTPENLSKNFGLYSIDPATRYPNAPMNYFKPHQVKHQYDCGDAQYLDEIVQISEQKSLRYEWIRDSHYLQKWFMRQLEAYRNLVKVLDLTTTWRSGMALCALIHKYRPELLDVFKLDPNEVAKNNQLAFDIAEKEFGISPVMTGADMAACEVPDKLSMVSYLSAFYEYFRKESIRPAKIARTPDHIPLPKGRTPRARSPAQRLSFLSRINNRMRARKSAGADQLSSDEEEEKENEGKETRPQLTFTYNFTRKRGHNDATQDPDNVVLQGYSKFESGTVEPASKSVKAPEVSKLHPGTRGKNKVSHLAKGLSQKFQRERPVATQVVKKPSSCKTSIIGQSGSSDMCYFCQKRVYVVERHTAEGVLFHRGCLKCEYCRTNLRIGQYSFERGVNGQANFYCIQHLGLARPVRKSRKRSYDEKELQARLAAQSSDEDLEGPSHKQEPNQEQSLDPPKTPERDGGLINPLNGAVGGALDKTPERIEYYTESEVEESEIEQTKHNLSASLLEGGQDSEESSSDELWSDEELSDTNDAPWAQIAQSYNKLSKLRKERKAAKRLAKPKEGEGSGSDTETLGSSDDWQSESETEKESEGEDSDTDRFRSVRQDDGPPAVMPCQFDSGDEDDYDPIPHRSPYHRSPRSPYGHQQHQRQQYQQQQQQQRSPLDNLRSPVDYEDKEPTPSQTAIRSNRLSFFSAVAEPVRIDPFSFLGLSPAPNIAQGEKSIEPKPEPEPEPEVEQEASTSETQEVEPDTALDQDLKEKEYEELEELEDETDSSLADSATITDGSESEEDQTGVVQKVHHPIPTISIEEVDMVDIGTEEDDEKEPDVDSIEALPTIESQIELDTRMESTSEDITQSISEIIEPVAEKDELALKKELDLVELEVEIMKKSVGDKIAELAKVADDQEPASLDEEPRPEELKIAASDEELKPSEAETVVSVEETEPSHPEIADLIEETKPTELESVPLVEETMPSERETAPVVDETILSELKTQPLVEETISSELKAADLMEEAVPSQPETATVIEETNPSQPLTSTLIDEIKPDVLETESIVEEPVPGELETPALDERVKPSEPDTAALVDLIRPDELETASMVEDTKTSEPEAVSLLKEAMPSELETPASFEAPETSLDKSFEIIEPPLVLDTESMEFMTTESADFEVVPKLSDTELPEAESVEEELGETVQSQEVPVSDSEEMKEAQNLASLSGKSSPLEVPSKEIEGKDIEGKQLEDIISSETEQAKSSIESKAFSNFQNLDSFETVSPLESESVSKESDRSIEIEYVTESKKISDGLDNVGTTSESSGAVCASKLNAALEEEVQKQADHSITFKSKTPGGDLKSYDNIDSVLGEENEGDQATDLDADKLSTTTAEDEEIPVLSKGEEDTAALAPVAAMSSVAPSDEDLVSKAMAPIASILEMDLQSEDLTPTMEQADWYENPPSEITPTAEKDFIQNGSHVIDSKNIVVDSITPERSARLDAQLPSDEKVDKTMQSKSVFPPLPAINAFPPLPVVNANLFAKLVHANEPSAHAIEPKQVNGENLNEAKDDLLTSSKSDNSLLTNKPTTKLQKQAGNSDLDIPPFKEKKVKDSENHSLVHPHVEEVKDTDSKLTRQMSAPESKVSKLLEDVPVKKTKKREPVFVKVPKIKPLVIPTGVPIAQAAAAAAKARLTGRPMNVDANKESIKAKKAKEEEVSRRLREEYRQAKEQKEKELEEMRKKREEENARKKRLKDEQIRRELEEARKKQEEEAKQLREERRKNAKPPQIEKLDSWKQEDAMKRIDSLLEGFRGQTHSQGDTLKTMARKQTEEISHLAKTLMASEFIPGRGPQEPKQHPLDSKPSVNFYPEEASSTEKPYHLDERFITTRDRNKRRRNLSNQSAKSDSSFTLSTPSGSVPSVSSVSEMGSAPTSVEISITDTGSIDLLANTSESVGENLSLDELDERDEFEDSIRVEGVKSADELESKSSELRPMSADAALTPSTAEVSKVEDSMHTAESSLSDSRTPNTSAADESQYYTPDVSGIDALDASDTSLTSKKPMNNRIANSIERKSADSLDTERSSSPISPGKGVDAKRKFFWEMPQPVRIDPKKMFHDLKTPEGENNNRSIEDHLNANKNQNGQDILSNAEKMKEWKSMDVANGKKKAGGLDLKRDWQSMDSSPNIETLSPTAGVPKTNIVNGEPETDVFYTPATTIKPQPSTSHDTRKESPRAKKRILPEKQEAARYQKESNQEKARLEARERARLLSDKDLGIAEKASKKAPKIVRSDSQPEPSKFGIKGPKLTKGKVKKPTAPQLQKVDGKHERVGSDSSSKSGGSPSHVENQRTAFSDGVSDHSESSPASSRRDLIKERTKSLDRDKSKRRHLETPKLEVAKSSEKKEKRRSFLAMLLPKRDKAKDKDRKSTGFISPKEEKKGKSPADKRSGVKLRSKLKTTKAEKEKEMNRSSTFADEFNPFFEDAYGMETKEKMKLKEKIDQVAPVPARTPPEARIAPKATVEEFDTESELGDDRISIHSFRSQLNVDEEDQGKQIKRQQKVAARRQKEQELKRLRMAQEIQRQLDEVEIKQRQVEMKGIAIERALRGEGPDAEREEAELMQEWFNSVHEKNMLVRYESELWVHARELELEDRHSRLELQLRDRMSIAETEMTPAQKEEEQRILEELLEVVEQRDSLVALLEEDRLREKEEDRDLEQMMSLKGFQLSPVSYMNRDRVPSLRTMDLSFNR